MCVDRPHVMYHWGDNHLHHTGVLGQNSNEGDIKKFMVKLANTACMVGVYRNFQIKNNKSFG
jgi:hypothetical protein